MPSYLVEIEHELAAALRNVDDQRELLRLSQEENEEKRRDIVWTMGERAKLMDRVQRLEEAGDALYEAWLGYGFTKDKHLAAWRKAKEDK